ncbi:hypothetical protein A2856_00340 [Candidatus Uhrbacteria bacterium RIFCSPHIGHO2_01_FULL_63_20]|uniref:DDH domain-containing protein n=1 Tax=Candidatus Uhrbacteria bacterium RIFCSPHIGHO2_01_FULL_63_20 TaxID=1802385 RepID=A0A1F7TLU3_9BACT|nr:MAG: hypothetical protein A2856_00340 [Candidatus Uhrbacteria bacterium RIFCSPHIGHO2_01_FULL_63_20]
MALTHTQQVLEAFKRCERPLLVVGAGSGPDGYATAIGLALVFEKLGKKPEIVAHDGVLPKNLSFLPGGRLVKPRLEKLRRFRIDLDTTKTAIEEISYHRTDASLGIELAPVSGFWEPHDVKTSASSYRFDLIVTVAAADLDACGAPYRENPDFFYRVPVVNLDHASANERYGAVNHVDLTACAVAEAAAELVVQMDAGLMDSDVATAFLAGMVAKTKSFKGPTVTPKTLEAAARLLTLGARRDEIVGSLYRTRSVATLRLWGRALARLKAADGKKLVWTLIGRQDFLHAGADEEDLPDVIEELIASCPEARVAAVLYESRDQSVRAVVRSDTTEQRHRFTDKTIVQAEGELVSALEQKHS